VNSGCRQVQSGIWNRATHAHSAPEIKPTCLLVGGWSGPGLPNHGQGDFRVGAMRECFEQKVPPLFPDSLARPLQTLGNGCRGRRASRAVEIRSARSPATAPRAPGPGATDIPKSATPCITRCAGDRMTAPTPPARPGTTRSRPTRWITRRCRAGGSEGELTALPGQQGSSHLIRNDEHTERGAVAPQHTGNWR
jgi:hypothetical protein